MSIIVLQIMHFADVIEANATLYGYREQTIYSMILLMLPSNLNNDRRNRASNYMSFHKNKDIFFHVEVLEALNEIGIDIIQVSTIKT